MSRPALTIATGRYDRVQPLIDGRVGIEGCDVNYLPLGPEETFYRAFTNREFDVTELSFSSYTIARSRGVTDYIAVPVFLSRMFRHSAVYIRTDAGIEAPADLNGREVGVPVYAMTAALWVRGMLEDNYGVRPADIHWRTGGLEEAGRYGKYPLNLPSEIRVEPIAEDRTLSRMLAEGEITALISAREPSCFARGDAGVARLFPDYRAVEQDYYRRTGLFPIMHVLAIRESLASAYPWLPSSVYKAFLEAKNLCLEEMRDVTALRVSTPWIAAELEAARTLMGDDPWPYGFSDNLKTLEIFTRWSHEHGLSVRRMDAAELFHPATLERARV